MTGAGSGTAMSAANAVELTDPRASAAINPTKVRRMRHPPVLGRVGVGHENEHVASKTEGLFFDLAQGVAHKSQLLVLGSRKPRFRLESSVSTKLAIYKQGLLIGCKL